MSAPTLREAVAILLLVLVSGCAPKLPPHVWLPVPRVQDVSLFWWTDTRQCNMRVVFYDNDRFPKGFTVPADASLCLAWLKSVGYDLSKIPVMVTPVVTDGAMPSAKDGAK